MAETLDFLACENQSRNFYRISLCNEKHIAKINLSHVRISTRDPWHEMMDPPEDFVDTDKVDGDVSTALSSACWSRADLGGCFKVYSTPLQSFAS